jgi:hypothetical protein
MSNLMPRKTPPPPNTSFYLGDRDESKRRRDRLDEIAADLGLKRSALIQQIADGDLVVVPRSQVKAAPALPTLGGQPLKVGLHVEVTATYKTPDVEIPAGQRGTILTWQQADDALRICVKVKSGKVWLPSPFLKLSE